jgi:tRNA 2-thiouridine synthesizing protein A
MDISGLNNSPDMAKSKAADRVLDITHEVCPMTFVRTRLALDRMAPGEVLLVLLQGDEPLRNVPRTAREQGHEILEQHVGEDGVTHLLIRKGAAPAG